jgi:hypothetical protein
VTINEYEDKKSKIQSSDAHPSIKEKALLELEYKFKRSYVSRNTAMKQFLESRSDIDDIGGH